MTGPTADDRDLRLLREAVQYRDAVIGALVRLNGAVHIPIRVLVESPKYKFTVRAATLILEEDKP